MDDRDIEYTMMNIQKYSGGMMSLVMTSTTMSVKLLIFLARMAQKKLVSIKFSTDYEKFLEKTQGNFKVYNIPLSKEHAQMLQDNLEKLYDLTQQLETIKNPLRKRSIQEEMERLKKAMPEIEQLDKLGIDHCVLPKINGTDNSIQVAVADKDGELFKNWFVNHLLSNMTGGPKDIHELEAMTERNFGIYNIPFEGEKMEAVLRDLETLSVNYSLMPDLNLGDGSTQIAIPNAEVSKLQSYFNIVRKNMMNEGIDVPDIQGINMDNYLNTSTMEPDDYINKADGVYKAENQAFEAQGETISQKPAVHDTSTEAFSRLMKDKNYQMISINLETLVQNVNPTVAKSMGEQGYFVSRIPGTWGKKEKDLLVPKNQVFVTDEGKTYLTFLSKNDPSMVFDAASGNVEKWSYEAILNPYQKNARGYQQVGSMIKEGVQPLQNTPDRMQSMPDRHLIQEPQASMEGNRKSKDTYEDTVIGVRKRQNSKNKFGQFQQREYDYNALEKLLIQKNQKASFEKTPVASEEILPKIKPADGSPDLSKEIKPALPPIAPVIPKGPK